MDGEIGTLNWFDCENCIHHDENGCNVEFIDVELDEIREIVKCEQFEDRYAKKSTEAL